jgi:hypothetical protein
MLFSVGAKVPTPSVINGAHSAWRRFRDPLEGEN